VRLTARVHGRSYRFTSVREVLARANEPKSGDTLAGIGARSNLERAAAKRVLAELTLEDLRAHPVASLDDDEVSRVIDAQVEEAVYREIRGWSVAELRDWILDDTTTCEAIRRVSRALTAEMAASVAKLCSNLDLVYGARKMPVSARARTTVGLPGRLSSRLQPNHPTDDARGITAAIYEGLAYGAGDALIGINPCIDTVENVTALLRLTADVIARWRIPTQNCVLAHVTTQMRALEAGAPMDILFQSLAGTEAGNASFGITVALLDEARIMIRERGTLRHGQLMYFETGQGSELSFSRQHGRRLHRSRVPRRRASNRPCGPGGSLHGQAPRRATRRRCLLHQSRRRGSKRLRYACHHARHRGLQLLHGCAGRRRRDAELSMHELP
jgi:ethanolamine ammonia-lyase large subunit